MTIVILPNSSWRLKSNHSASVAVYQQLPNRKKSAEVTSGTDVRLPQPVCDDGK